MAGQSDAEKGLEAAITALLYPNGTGQPSAVGAAVKVYRGWPNSASLDADLAAGTAHVSISPHAGGSRNVTASLNGWVRQGPVVQPTLSWAISGTTATLSGTISTPQAVALVVNGAADGNHVVASGDTLASIASAIAGQIAGASAAGAVITVPGAASLTGRVGVMQPMMRETRRQRVVMSAIIWTPTPDLRDAIADLLDAGLAPQAFVPLADYTQARIRWQDSRTVDFGENANEYRRDLIYSVEYATIQTMLAPQAIVIRADVSAVDLTIGPQTATAEA